MPISIPDLDALVGYDPASHTIAGLPSMASPALTQGADLNNVLRPVAAEHNYPATKMPAIPSSASTNPLSGVVGQLNRPFASNQLNTSRPESKAPATLPSMIAAPDIAPSEIPSMPSLAAPVPAISKPTKQEATTAGKREYAEGIPVISANPQDRGEYDAQQLALSDYKRAHPEGSAISSDPGTWGKIKHGFALAGNVAGDILDPGAMERIPGTQLHEQAERNAWTAGIGETAKNALTKAQTEETQANAWKALHPNPTTPFEAFEVGNPNRVIDWQKLQTESGKTPEERVYDADIASGKSPQDALADVNTLKNTGKAPTPEQDKQRMDALEQSLASGTISDADRNWLAGQQRAAKISGVGPEIVSQAGQPPVPADYPKGTSDEKYKAANTAWGKQVEDLKNQEAAASGAARGAAYQGSKPLAVADENGNIRYVTAQEAEAEGLSPASEAVKTGAKLAQMNDIVNASQQVRAALQEVGNTAFTPAQTAKLSMAMKETDPTVMHDEIANLAASGLTPRQQDLVTWLYQLQERALSLRSIAGMGQGSETTRMAILKALPGITSGNIGMALKQLDAFDNMVGNLRAGMAGVKGRLGNPQNTGNQGGNAPPSFSEWKAKQGK